MTLSLDAAISGMKTQQQNIEIIANNLANVNTTGFKKSDARFEDLLYVNTRNPGAVNKDGSTISGLQLGSGSQLVSTSRNFQSGVLIQTDNPLDLVIEGADHTLEIPGDITKSLLVLKEIVETIQKYLTEG